MSVVYCSKKVSWSAPTPTPLGYEVYYRAIGDSVYSMVFTTNLFADISVQEPYQYEGYVRAKCSDTLFSTIATFSLSCYATGVVYCEEYYNNTGQTYNIDYVECSSVNDQYVNYNVDPGQSACVKNGNMISGNYGFLITQGSCQGIVCDKYILETTVHGSTITWTDCISGNVRNLNLSLGYQIAVCSRTVPTGTGIQIITTTNCD